MDIAVAGEYRSTKDFIQYKFGSRILAVNHQTQKYSLDDGSHIHCCYGDANKYLSILFDACIILPDCPINLAIGIMERCWRPK